MIRSNSSDLIAPDPSYIMPIQEREPRSEVLTMLGDCLMSSPKVGKAQRKPVAGARKASARVRAGGVRPVLRAKAMKASSFLSKVGDPTRICIILAISDGGLSVASICSAIGQSVPGTSHHLALLRHQGVLQKAETGERLYSLSSLGRRLESLLYRLLPLNSALAAKVRRPSAEAERRRPDAVIANSYAPIDPLLLEEVGNFLDDPTAWFLTPNSEFEDRRPIDLLGTSDEP